MNVAVLADIVGSRRLPDRAAAQSTLDGAIAQVEREFPDLVRPLRPTVGDEQQALYPDLDSAMAALLLLQLTLPEGLECRFGIGVGDVLTVPAAGGSIPEGPGWWAARDAIEMVHSLQKRTAPRARTWVVAAERDDAHMERTTRLANAYLLARDEIVGSMSARARRLTYGRCRGIAQRDLAESEGITQSAVSQALAVAGAASLIQGFLELTGGRSS
ncbi:SatD family protein [Microbacterium sp. SLBN-146]|uniref:SatD family protein n=1 Tax=Microbacterium sp. SLBN-146 TaxID=2768457 RepID=UPI001154B663|nr:SatD family protein [Microbacterium sp. SLBN-146]TQJ32440.1 SatD family protein [Microbacterium sp. SLBN-146]